MKDLDPNVVREELNRRAIERRGVNKVLSNRFPPSVNQLFDEEVQRLLARHFGLRHFDAVLEIGTGIGRLAHFFAERCGRYVGVDFSKEMLAHASYMLRGGDTIELLLCDANDARLEFPRGAFELGIVSLVLKHNNDQRAEELIDRLKRWCREVLLIEHVAGGAVGSDIAIVRDESWYSDRFKPLVTKNSHRFKRHEDDIVFEHFVTRSGGW